MKTNIKNHRGYLLVELLVTMLLLSLFLALIFPYLKASSTLLKQVKNKEDFELVSERVLQTINEGINNAKSFSAINSVIVHPPGTIRALDGNQAFQAQLSKYPIAKSNRPLSFMQVIKDLPISVDSSETSGLTTQFVGCIINSNSNNVNYSFYNDQRWLIMSLDGIYTMQGRIITIKAKALCSHGYAVRLDLTLKNNPVFGNASKPLPDNSTFLIYPIENEFTIYLDQKGFIRKLFHRTLVSQRLVSNIEDLVIAPLEQRKTGSIFNANVIYKNQSKSKTFTSGSSQELLTLDLIL